MPLRHRTNRRIPHGKCDFGYIVGRWSPRLRHGNRNIRPLRPLVCEAIGLHRLGRLSPAHR